MASKADRYPGLSELGIEDFKHVRDSGRQGSFITPRGTVGHAFLNRARDFDGDGKFNFTAKLYLPADSTEAQELKQLIDTIYETNAERFKAEQAALKDPKKRKKLSARVENPVLIEDEESPFNGMLMFKFKQKRDILDKKDPSKVVGHRVIRFVDGRGQQIPNERRPLLGTGTIAKLSFTPFWYNTPLNSGVRLGVSAIQILKLIKYEGVRDNFEADDEGYVYEDDGSWSDEGGDADEGGFTRASAGGSGDEGDSGDEKPF